MLCFGIKIFWLPQNTETFLFILFNYFQKFADPGKYALIGAAAMLGMLPDFHIFLHLQHWDYGLTKIIAKLSNRLSI